MPFSFRSTEGRKLCEQILKETAPNSDTHDWQLDVITRLLDRQDVLAITATGSGKTEMFIRLMQLVKVLSTHPVGKNDSRFPADPAMIVVCPTKALEEEMESRMCAAGVMAVAINADRVSITQNAGHPDLYEQVRTGVTVVLVSPEQLASPRFKATIDSPAFKKRVCMMAVDEAHLMNTWGRTFRKDYQQIGWMRARLPNDIPTLAVTATMQAGPPTQNVLDFLGFQEGSYHVLRRSNMRHDFRIVFRTCRSGIGSSKFPELDWVLASPRRKVLIFCKTIHLGFRIDAYLYHHNDSWALDEHKRAKRVRMFNALNWKSYNDETLALWKSNDPDAQIIVATSILSVGIDAPSFDDVVIFGEPDEVDEYWQELGRLRPRRSTSIQDGDSTASGPRGILYLTRRAEETAHSVLSSQKAQKPPRLGVEAPTMTLAVAELILAKCKVAALDKIYDNPIIDPPCPCTFCARYPVAAPPSKCECSGCQPEGIEEVIVGAEKSCAEATPKKVPKRRGISKAMRTAGTLRLQAWRMVIFRGIDLLKYGYLPPPAFLPDDKIKHLLNQIYTIAEVKDVSAIVGDIPFTRDRYYEDLFAEIQGLTTLFEAIRMKQAEERRASRVRGKDKLDAGGPGSESDQSLEGVPLAEPSI